MPPLSNLRWLGRYPGSVFHARVGESNRYVCGLTHTRWDLLHDDFRSHERCETCKAGVEMAEDMYSEAMG